MLVCKRDWGSVSGHKVLFTVTYQERVRRENRGKEIDWETVVEEHTKEYRLKNTYSHDLLWIKVSALLCFIM